MMWSGLGVDRAGVNPAPTFRMWQVRIVIGPGRGLSLLWPCCFCSWDQMRKKHSNLWNTCISVSDDLAKLIHNPI